MTTATTPGRRPRWPSGRVLAVSFRILLLVVGVFREREEDEDLLAADLELVGDLPHHRGCGGGVIGDGLGLHQSERPVGDGRMDGVDGRLVGGLEVVRVLGQHGEERLGPVDPLLPGEGGGAEGVGELLGVVVLVGLDGPRRELPAGCGEVGVDVGGDQVPAGEPLGLVGSGCGERRLVGRLEGVRVVGQHVEERLGSVDPALPGGGGGTEHIGELRGVVEFVGGHGLSFVRVSVE